MNKETEEFLNIVNNTPRVSSKQVCNFIYEGWTVRIKVLLDKNRISYNCTSINKVRGSLTTDRFSQTYREGDLKFVIKYIKRDRQVKL